MGDATVILKHCYPKDDLLFEAEAAVYERICTCGLNGQLSTIILQNGFSEERFFVPVYYNQDMFLCWNTGMDYDLTDHGVPHSRSNENMSKRNARMAFMLSEQ
ncbi:hypothetical protein N7454_007817 [Penicillium verhagenii]|nr:hypothetical protein N7454_007817 [Penicillium verhagenii]